MINALDLLNEVADRMGWPQITTLEKQSLPPEHRKMLRLLNRVLRAAGAFNDWPLLQKDAQIVLVASETTDADNSEYVTATQNSATVTVDNATFDETYIGRAFQVSGDDYVYRIAAVPSATTLTLNRAWVSDNITASDEKVTTIAMDRYALPSDFDRPIGDVLNFAAPFKIAPISPYEFKQIRYASPGVVGQTDDPGVYTIYGMTDNQAAQMLHFHPYPKNARILEYTYIQVHPEIDSDQDKILYPLSYLEAFIGTLLYIANRDYEDASPAKTQQILFDAMRSHNLQQSSAGPTESDVRLRPANNVRRSLRRAYGVPGMRVDWGSTFETGHSSGLYDD